MAEQPQRLCRSQGVDAEPCPPVHFLAGTVQFAMMRPAQWNGEFVAYLLAKPVSLRESQWCASQGCRPQTRQG
jgi:hypothetical protein